ncbi:uncharacterized protein [Aristolochia californica]|uniref:uncharacterized protein n=1 Tax=Aristolochia californica TaxID=171875 RepID=UPI0035DF21B7
MDSFEIDPVKAEKTMAMRRYHRIHKLASIFRYVEVFVGLVFLSWISFRLPIAMKISGDLFRQVLDLVVSPWFVFLVGNAIIITLVSKSGQFSVNNSPGSSSSASTDLYEEFLKNSESRAKVRTEEAVVYQDKAVCVESRFENADTSSRTISPNKKKSLKCRTERMVFPETKPAIEWSEMDTRREDGKCEEAIESSFETDMSNEEFRRAVEAFIAKQQKFQRQESMAIVLHDCL